MPWVVAGAAGGSLLWVVRRARAETRDTESDESANVDDEPNRTPPVAPLQVLDPATPAPQPTPVVLDPARSTPQQRPTVDMATAGVWVWPVPIVSDRVPVISDPWGSRRRNPDGTPRLNRDGSARTHEGVDVMFKRRRRGEFRDLYRPGTPNGTDLYYLPDDTLALAASAGVVWSTGRSERGGYVVLDHGRPWATFYRHLERIFVERGQSVVAGQPIGIVGGDPLDRRRLKHLHFEVQRKGALIDPEPLMARWQMVRIVERSGGNPSITVEPRRSRTR